MITHLHGVLTISQSTATGTHIVLDVQGVGYALQVSQQTLAAIQAYEAQKIQLLTHYVVREDAHLLYGFHTEAERQFFRRLLKINGIGAKLALGMLSVVSVKDLYGILQGRSLKALTALPGIGKKTAERILLDFQDLLPENISVNIENHAFMVPDLPTSAAGEAVAALVSLGYRQQEAQQKVQRCLQRSPDLTTEALIKQSLQEY